MPTRPRIAAALLASLLAAAARAGEAAPAPATASGAPAAVEGQAPAGPSSPAPATQAPSACVPGPVLALDGLGTPDDDLARVMEIVGAAPLEPGLIRRAGLRYREACEGAAPVGWSARLARPAPPDLHVQVLPARLSAVWNSTYPSGGNDGLLWAGRGFGVSGSVGVAARWRWLSAAVAPELAWQQNDWFQTTPTGQPGDAAYANPWYGANLDFPQRFGEGPYGTASLGQSYLRADAFGVALGVSTENRWWGPGTRNALLLTNTAPGFPHAFVGTARPVDIWIGTLEALALWGQLKRSSYYATPGGHPWLTSLAVDYSPKWVPGLTVGAARVFVETWQSLKDDHFLTIFEGVLKSQVAGGDNPYDNQLASLWFRWVMPEARFEFYGEWGRDDFPISVAGLTRELDRTSGYVAGFQKAFPLGGARLVRVHGEVARLYEARPLDAYGGLPVWYTHGEDLGHAHRGQLLGAAAGPGGASLSLAVDVFGEGGRLGGWIERVARNEEAYWYQKERDPAAEHDVELVGGVRQVLFAGPVEVAWHLSGAFRWARDFRWNEPNLQAGVEVRGPVGGRTVAGR